MKQFFSLLVLVAMFSGLCFAVDAAPAAAKTIGKAPTLAEATPIATLAGHPDTYKDKDVMVAGKILRVCQGSGCWVEVEGPDSSKIICKSMDESVLFPKDCVGKLVKVQGKLFVDAKSSGEDKMVSHEKGEAPHACPAPKVMVALTGATLEAAVAATDAPAAPVAK